MENLSVKEGVSLNSCEIDSFFITIIFIQLPLKTWLSYKK